MKNLKHPAFLLGIFSMLLVFFAIGMKANGYRAGDYILIFSVILGAVHWIWSILDVTKRSDMKPFQKRFWLIAVIAAPVMGGLIFYALHQRAGRITT